MKSEAVFGILFGQLLSLLITGTGIFSTFLTNNGVDIPVTQSFLLYLSLSFLCIYLHHKGKFLPILKDRYGLYLLIAFADVEANFLVVKAYQYTTITSVMLLDCFTIPVSMLLSRRFLHVKYDVIRCVGVGVCVLGLVLLVMADYLLAEETPQTDPLSVLLGDALVLMGASLYATSNVSQEYAVNAFSRLEFLAFLGLFGTLISGCQMALLEWESLASIEWTWKIAGDLLGFSSCLLAMYVVTPTMIKMSSAVVLNLSLLTSDFYAVIAAIFLFDQSFSYLYVVAFAVTMSGLLVYHLPIEKPWPTWIVGKGDGVKEEEEGEELKGKEEIEEIA